MVMNRGHYRTDHESVSDGKINEGNRRAQLPPLHEPRTSLRSYPPPEAGRRIVFPTQDTKKQFPQAEAKNAAQNVGMLPKVQGTNRGNSKFVGYVPGLTVRDAERQPIKEELSYLDKAMGKPTNLFPDVKDSQGIATRHMQKIKMKPRTLLTFEVMDQHQPQPPETRYNDLPHIGAQPKMSPRASENRMHTPPRCDSRAGGQKKLPSLAGGRPGTSKARRGAPKHGY